ncbi:MAG: hypothetical protein M1120_02045 [Patescibacteria group bacterium]|nr:hypothetical protein [Patescibacteria group bacterium]
MAFKEQEGKAKKDIQDIFVEAAGGDEDALKKFLELGADKIILVNGHGKSIDSPDTTVTTVKK